MWIKLELYIKKNIIMNHEKVESYKETKVGELVFESEVEAVSIRTQMLRQHLFDEIKIIKI